MAIKGIELLPPNVSEKEAIKILAMVSRIGEKVSRLSAEFSHSVVNENFISILSYNESVQSTRIEGTQVTFTDVLEEKNKANPRWEVQEVINYNRALSEGVSLLKNGYPISSRLITDLHSILMSGARGATGGKGSFRKIQNFIGPNNKIEDAIYIPIAANEISEYMSNLEHYINGSKHFSFKNYKNGYTFDENSHPLIRAAIVHVQFESIHPFLDGNGRLGRILIILNLLNDKMIDFPCFFVSEELEKERERYYDLLNGVRGNDPDWFSWISFFLKSCDRMADSLLKKLQSANRLARDGVSQLNLSSEKQIWLLSFSEPLLTVNEATKLSGLSDQTVRLALTKLVELDLLYTEKSVKRNRKYRNYDLMRILSDS